MKKIVSGKKGSGEVLKISGSQTIANTNELRSRFLEAVKKHQHIILDLNEIRNCDITFLQLLISLKKTCRIKGNKVRIRKEIPPKISKMINGSGLFPHLKPLLEDETKIDEGDSSE